MLLRLLVAVVVGVLTAAFCKLAGGLLVNLHEEFSTTVGNWLISNASLLGLCAALLEFAGHNVISGHFNKGD